MPREPLDWKLVLRAREGDEAAWRAIYDTTRERLFALLVYQCGDRDEARDLLQETYLAAWRGLGAYRGDAPLESWLIGIALRRARDWKRRWLPRRASAVDFAEAGSHLVARPDADPPLGAQLQRALAALPERQRSAFLLHEWLDYPFEEIGALLGISEATARVHSHRARLALRERLEKDESVPVTGQLRENES